MGFADTLLARVATGDVEIILDLSRLLSRSLHGRPTGVDRVEMAYARHLSALLGERLAFAAVHPSGRYGRLPRDAVVRFLDDTEARWANGVRRGWWQRRIAATRSLVRLLPRSVPRSGARRYYVQASPNHLDRDAIVARKLRREGAAFVCLVHDLIPIELPEYARPGGAAQHARRMATLAAHARLLIANSAATARSMRTFLASQGRKPAVLPILLGTDQSMEREGEGVTPALNMPSPDMPYFLIIGTIEPRKNHILLLNLWRQMLQGEASADAPTLIVAGRRGWENEHVIDMLERSSAIGDHVIEYRDSSDDELAVLMRGARALLLPSFAEGFGMPVAEALMAGTPVICSDLPALREVGGIVPDYLDPLDGAAWLATISDYAKPSSVMRAAQLDRMNMIDLPTWEAHFSALLEAIGDIDCEIAGTDGAAA